jgi:hypothetical protein
MLCRRRASKNPEFQLMYMCKALQGCPGTRPGVHVNMLENLKLRSILSTRQQVRYMHIMHAA